MKLYELAYVCRLYPYFGDFDRSLTMFWQQIGFELDINKSDHHIELFKWLKSWRCRQFTKKGYATASQSLVAWGKDYINRLPPKKADLLKLTDADLNLVAEAYGALKDRVARTRFGKSVRFGPTGAAKVIFALRPHTFAPWDNPIRQHFKYDGSADSYRRFLDRVQTEIRELVRDAARFGFQSSEIPSKVNRTDCTLPKLIDEYNWVVITKGLKPPDQKELKDWLKWALK